MLSSRFLLKSVILIMAVASFGCSDDPDIDIVRDTDKMTFSFNESTEQFTVRSSGQWSVTSPETWLSFDQTSGSGNGKDYQYVNVTAAHNPGTERTGTIYLTGGGRTVEIAVTQEDGIFAIGEASLEGNLVVNRETTAILSIPYSKATGDEIADVTIELSGDGANGVTVAQPANEKLSLGNGTIRARFNGTPTTMGDIIAKITVTVDGKSFGPFEAEVPVISTNIIFSQYFDLFQWGGDIMANKRGVKPSADRYDPYDTDLVECTAGTDGTGDLFKEKFWPNWIDNVANPRGMHGWTGYTCYERPGYIKVGTGSNGGWLRTPPLDLSSIGGEGDIYVKFDFACYPEAADLGKTTAFRVEGAGTPSINSLTSTVSREWVTYTIKITGAKSGVTMLVWGNNVGNKDDETRPNSRFVLDNIEVIAEGEDELEAPLEAPQDLAVSDISNTFATLKWSQVPYATGYLVRVQMKDNPTFGREESVDGISYTFQGLSAGTDYEFLVKAVYSLDETFNSEWSEPEEFTTLATLTPIATPTVTLFSATHRKLVIDWGLIPGQWDDLTNRPFVVELAETADGPALRSYQVTATNRKYKYNRFVFGGLEPSTTYVCRVQLLPLSTSMAASEFGTVSASTTAEPTIPSNAILYKDFEQFSYGGDAMNAAFGYYPGDAVITANFDKAQEFSWAMEWPNNTVKNTPSNFGTLAAAYALDRWGENHKTDQGWTGERVYEVSGYLKFGTGSGNGTLTTPKLSALTSATDINVQFKACPYTEPNSTSGALAVSPALEDGDTFKIKIVGPGSFDSSSSLTEIELTNTKNSSFNDPDLLKLEWTQHNIPVYGATSDTQITIYTTATAGKYRMWLDDYIITR